MIELQFNENDDVVIYDDVANKLYHNQKLIPPTAVELSGSVDIRLYLGNACNQNCEFCYEGSHKGCKDLNKEHINFPALAEKIKSVLGNRKIKQVSFWGGEPLLYWDSIKEYYPIVKEKWGFESCLISTNATMLNKEITDFIINEGIFLGISYDGPGQSLRHLNPFPKQKENILRVLNNDRTKVSFNGVFSKYNDSVKGYIEHLTETLGTSEFNIGKINPIILYGNRLNNNVRKYCLEEGQLIQFYSDIYSGVCYGSLLQHYGYQYKQAIEMISKKLGIVDYACPPLGNYLFFDLEGNILQYDKHMTNNMIDGRLLGEGNIFNITAIEEVPTLIMPETIKKIHNYCNECNMKFFCNGGVFYDTENEENQRYNCRNSYLYTLMKFYLYVSDLVKAGIKCSSMY